MKAATISVYIPLTTIVFHDVAVCYFKYNLIVNIQANVCERSMSMWLFNVNNIEKMCGSLRIITD